MNIAFYITNHGFGHASRNVPIVKELLHNKAINVFIKSDDLRIGFLRRNFNESENMRIKYYADCKDVGLVLKQGTFVVDLYEQEKRIIEDKVRWTEYIENETAFLKREAINVVVSDIIPWIFEAAAYCNIPSVLIGNFSWAQSYESIGLSKETWKHYENAYKKASLTLWYELHDKSLEQYTANSKNVSLVSRKIDYEKVSDIREKYNKRPIAFVSVGASADIGFDIDVSKIDCEVLHTRGLKLKGENAHELPLDTINTPDYIAAADYIIIKGGWSTIAEVLLQKKVSAMLFRPDVTEDRVTKAVLQSRKQCIEIKPDDLMDINRIINELDDLRPAGFDCYRDDTKIICQEIMGIA